MSTELLPSDVLSTLRRIADADIACEQSSDINPRELLALIECAEIVQIVYLVLEPGLQMRALKALGTLEGRS